MNQEQITKNVEAGLVYTGYPYVEPGFKAFMVITDRSGSFIIEVLVEEVNDIYSQNNNSPSIWAQRDIFGTDSVAVPNGEQDENGWNKHRYVTHAEFLKEFPLARRVNQFLWLDEPIGHGIGLGNDGVFPSLNEAMLYAYPSKKKHLRRRLKARRNRYIKFINSTWENDGEVIHYRPRYSDKKIYVRRK